MTSLSDTLTVGLVLVLLFGSIALYLYTRIQQAEQKISLLESILLDLKMTSEIKSYSELPADSPSPVETAAGAAGYAPFSEENDEVDDIHVPYTAHAQSKTSTPSPSVSGSIEDSAEADVTQYKSVIADAVNGGADEAKPEVVMVAINYEAMSLKELQNLAKTRGITGAGSMKKSSVIEALKTSDRATTLPQPGSNATSSFLETSGTFQATDGGADESE
jgi:hypothetical protein